TLTYYKDRQPVIVAKPRRSAGDFTRSPALLAVQIPYRKPLKLKLYRFPHAEGSAAIIVPLWVFLGDGCSRIGTARRCRHFFRGFAFACFRGVALVRVFAEEALLACFDFLAGAFFFAAAAFFAGTFLAAVFFGAAAFFFTAAFFAAVVFFGLFFGE